MRTGKLVNCFKTRRFREGRSDDLTVIIIVADKFSLKPETVRTFMRACKILEAGHDGGSRYK